jgi:hypothetical protein
VVCSVPSAAALTFTWSNAIFSALGSLRDARVVVYVPA